MFGAALATVEGIASGGPLTCEPAVVSDDINPEDATRGELGPGYRQCPHGPEVSHLPGDVGHPVHRLTAMIENLRP